MLGNDVVDLLDVDARPETFRRRFDERVFAAEERSALAQDVAVSRSPALRWAHWAAKEAAYKLLRRIDPTFVFSPRRLVACFEPASTVLPSPASTDSVAGLAPILERRGRLEVVGVASPLAAALSLRSFESRDFVHVVALPADGDWSAVVMEVDVLPAPRVSEAHAAPGKERVAEAGRASAAVRRLALRVLAQALAVDASRLAIGRRDRIPSIELDGRTLPVPLSLSHHGRFVAFAAAAPGPEALRARGERDGRDERDERTAQGAVTRPIGVKALAAADRGISRVRIASVRRTSGEGGGPFASVDTAWMVG